MSIQNTRPVITQQALRQYNIEFLNAGRLGAQNPILSGLHCQYSYDEAMVFRCGIGAAIPEMALIAIKQGHANESPPGAIREYVTWDSEHTKELAEITQSLHDNWQASAVAQLHNNTPTSYSMSESYVVENWMPFMSERQFTFITGITDNGPITEATYRDWIENYL